MMAIASILEPQEQAAVESAAMEIEQALDEFEKAWVGGRPPDVLQVLQTVSRAEESSPRRREIAGEIVMIDLWHRWRRANSPAGDVDGAVGESPNEEPSETPPEQPGGRRAGDRLPVCPRLDDYAAALPELLHIDELSSELIGEEYRARCRWADPPPHEEYLRRFPQQAQKLPAILRRIDRESPAARSRDLDTAAVDSLEETRANVQPAAARSSVDFVPKKIGKYVVLSALDRGGQARVYRAVHPQLRQPVAIKLGHPLPRYSDHVRRLLIDEARLLAQLDHPHLVRVHDLDFHDGRPYVVMDYIPGRNLHQLALEENIPPRRAAEMVANIADALAAVHAKGITHRDLKPGNVLVDEQGQPRLIDFGLARERNAWSTLNEPQENITGTLRYMAPEQAGGDKQDVGPRTDIFGLGAVLYFLLTRRPPIAEGTFDQVLSRVRRGEIDWDALAASSAPPALAAICRKAMSARADDRYHDAGEMASELERWLGRQQRWRRRVAIAAAAVISAIVLALALAWPLFSHGDPPAHNGSNASHLDDSQVNRAPSPAVALLGRQPNHDFNFRMNVAGHDVGEETITLEDGQHIALQVTSDKDCYVGLWYVDARGGVTQLFPNDRQQDHFLPAGGRLTIPGDDGYAIQVSQANGPEYLHAAASTRPWPVRAGAALGPDVVFASADELRRFEDDARSATIVAGDGPRVAEEVIQINVLPAP